MLRCRLAVVPVAIVLVVLTVTAPNGFAAPPAGLTITPNGGLADGQWVLVTGTGFEPNTLMEIFQCRAGAVDEFGCDADNSDFVDTDSSGALSYWFMVDARIFLENGTEVDCRISPGACVIGVGFLVDADQAVTAPLDFDPTAPLRPPVTATVAPTTGLTDGQVVQVHGAGLSPRSEAFAYQCITGQDLSPEVCAFTEGAIFRGVPDPDGAIDFAFTVRAALHTTSGATFDCTSAPGSCDLRLSSGLSEDSDREARVPLTFDVLEEPTMPSTTPIPPTTTPRFTG